MRLLGTDAYYKVFVLYEKCADATNVLVTYKHQIENIPIDISFLRLQLEDFTIASVEKRNLTENKVEGVEQSNELNDVCLRKICSYLKGLHDFYNFAMVFTQWKRAARVVCTSKQIEIGSSFRTKDQDELVLKTFRNDIADLKLQSVNSLKLLTDFYPVSLKKLYLDMINMYKEKNN